MITSGNDFASAFFMLAVENDRLDEYAEDLDIIGRAFRDNPDFSLLVTSPDIPESERLAVIDAAFGGRVSECSVNFIKVLCAHKKITLLDDCIKDFGALKKIAENRVTAYVYTAIPLTDGQKNAIKEKLQKKLGREVKIKSVVDNTMLGGVKIEVDSKIIDGSVKRQLHDIKEVISG